jgi:tetratricopeptide (TPR) repeat protein
MALKLKVLLFLLVISPLALIAQAISWPSPEVEQMYRQAREQHSRGNLNQAITLYKQTIKLAPTIMLLHRELGQALYLSGSYEEAISTLEAVIEAGAADEETYHITVSSLMSKNERKKARNLLKDGLERYPHSGLLYHLSGKIYESDDKMEEALAAWLTGIENDPAYHINYYDAARAYMNTDHPVWTIIYGEVFVNIEQQTPRSHDVRKMIIDAYRKMYQSVRSEDVPKYGTVKYNTANGFEQAIQQTYMKLAPVVADGFTTENLTMLRTRFIMDWQVKGYESRYPLSLFSRHDDMIRNGYFDIYNQWLFGKAENPQAFDAWVKFHADAMPDMEDYFKTKPYRPVAKDFYNKKDVEDIFKKKKKS